MLNVNLYHQKVYLQEWIESFQDKLTDREVHLLITCIIKWQNESARGEFAVCFGYYSLYCR